MHYSSGSQLHTAWCESQVSCQLAMTKASSSLLRTNEQMSLEQRGNGEGKIQVATDSKATEERDN